VRLAVLVRSSGVVFRLTKLSDEFVESFGNAFVLHVIPLLPFFDSFFIEPNIFNSSTNFRDAVLDGLIGIKGKALSGPEGSFRLTDVGIKLLVLPPGSAS
jgi:hypothetical protein